jgi:hypothetical protein
MKKLMSIMLGLSLIIGSAAVVVAGPQDKEPEKGKGKGKGKKGGDKDGKGGDEKSKRQ